MVEEHEDGSSHVIAQRYELARLGWVEPIVDDDAEPTPTERLRTWLTPNDATFAPRYHGSNCAVYLPDRQALINLVFDLGVEYFNPIVNPDGWRAMQRVLRSRSTRTVDEIWSGDHVREDELERFEREALPDERWRWSREEGRLTLWEGLGDGEWYEDASWKIRA